MNQLMQTIQLAEPGLLAGLAGSQDVRGTTRFQRDMQATLAPAVDWCGLGLEVHGLTIPKEDVGGDLADLAVSDTGAVAYVADVSGHGLRAAMLMGMLKTGLRYGLRLGRPLPDLLDDLNLLLPALKEPNMFATFAALRFDGSGEAEYLSAGHLPLLHYRHRTGQVIRHSMPQFPLGLFTGFGYTSQRIHFEPDDLFALVTDGVVEAGADRDLRCGLERLTHVLRDRANLPLLDIRETVLAAAAAQGPRHDDQTVLLVRALPTASARPVPKVRAGWPGAYRATAA